MNWESFSNLSIYKFLRDKYRKLLFVAFLFITCFIILGYNSLRISFPVDSEIRFPNSISAIKNKSLDILSSNPVSFTISQITPKQLQLINYNISYQDYFDKNFSRDCGIPNGHRQLFDLMKFWINFTATHDIPWWLGYGSLIGSIR